MRAFAHMRLRNFCSVCTRTMQYIPLCCTWHFLYNDMIFVAFEKKSKKMLITCTSVVVHPCGDVTFAHVT